MRNRIQKSMIFVVTMSLLISYILVTLVIYRQALDIRRSELVQEAGYIRAAIEISGEEYFGTMDKVSKRTRVTWIDKDGKVLYDAIYLRYRFRYIRCSNKFDYLLRLSLSEYLAWFVSFNSIN